MNKLRDGVELAQICYNSDETITAGKHGCESIVVTEENGQMAPVPWALVTADDGREFLINLATVESVKVASREEKS